MFFLHFYHAGPWFSGDPKRSVKHSQGLWWFFFFLLVCYIDRNHSPLLSDWLIDWLSFDSYWPVRLVSWINSQNYCTHLNNEPIVFIKTIYTRGVRGIIFLNNYTGPGVKYFWFALTTHCIYVHVYVHFNLYFETSVLVYRNHTTIIFTACYIYY